MLSPLCRLLKPVLPVAVSVLLVLALGSAASACSTCKVALENHDVQRGNMVAGYFWSILFMLSMPPTIFGGLCTYFYWEVRRARAAGPSSPLASQQRAGACR